MILRLARDMLVSKLPVSGELLRCTLLERTVRHARDVGSARAAKGIRSSC
jgi:hypothetical protein